MTQAYAVSDALDHDAAGFHAAVRDLVRVQGLRDRDRVAPCGVTVSGAYALDALARLGPLSLNAVAAELFVDKSTACRIVGALEDRGLLLRGADPADGRAIRVQLTDAGRELNARLHEEARWEMEAMLAGFGADERAAALRFLRRLTRTSAQHAGARAASCCRPDAGEG